MKRNYIKHKTKGSVLICGLLILAVYVVSFFAVRKAIGGQSMGVPYAELRLFLYFLYLLELCGGFWLCIAGVDRMGSLGWKCTMVGIGQIILGTGLIFHSVISVSQQMSEKDLTIHNYCNCASDKAARSCWMPRCAMMEKARWIQRPGAGEARLEAERVAEEARNVVAMPVREAPKVAGVSVRRKYKAKVIDLSKLVKAVSDGKAPLSCLKADDSACNKLANAYGGQNPPPGLHFYQDETTAARGR